MGSHTGPERVEINPRPCGVYSLRRADWISALGGGKADIADLNNFHHGAGSNSASADVTAETEEMNGHYAMASFLISSRLRSMPQG
jgi:hypothetical protein